MIIIIIIFKSANYDISKNNLWFSNGEYFYSPRPLKALSAFMFDLLLWIFSLKCKRTVIIFVTLILVDLYILIIL